MNIIIIAVALCGQCTNGKCNAGPQLSVEQRQQMLLDSSNGNLAAQYSNQQTCNNGQYNSQYQQPQQSQSQEFAYPSMEEMNLRLLYQKALQEPLTEEEAIQYRKTRYAVEMQRREALTRANRIAAFALKSAGFLSDKQKGHLAVIQNPTSMRDSPLIDKSSV